MVYICSQHDKCHIFSLAVPARENMWHFIMSRENIFHISLKQKKYPLNILPSEHQKVYFMSGAATSEI
jgi:hypothetical protein